MRAKDGALVETKHIQVHAARVCSTGEAAWQKAVKREGQGAKRGSRVDAKLSLVDASAIALSVSMPGRRVHSSFGHLNARPTQIVLWAGYGEARGRQTECTTAVQALLGVSSGVDSLVPMAGDKVMSFIVNPRHVPLQLQGPGCSSSSCFFGVDNHPRHRSHVLVSCVAVTPRPIFSHPRRRNLHCYPSGTQDLCLTIIYLGSSTSTVPTKLSCGLVFHPKKTPRPGDDDDQVCMEVGYGHPHVFPQKSGASGAWPRSVRCVLISQNSSRDGSKALNPTGRLWMWLMTPGWVLSTMSSFLYLKRSFSCCL